MIQNYSLHFFLKAPKNYKGGPKPIYIWDCLYSVGVIPKVAASFLQSGHIFRSKVFTPVRLKVFSRLILRLLRLRSCLQDSSFAAPTENKSWLFQGPKTTGLLCAQLTYIYYCNMRLLLMGFWAFAEQKRDIWKYRICGSGSSVLLEMDGS